MMMIKEGIFAGHPSLALSPLHLALLALASLAKMRAETAKRKLKQQTAS